MKKISLVALLILSLFLLGCGNQQTNNEDSREQSYEQQQEISKSKNDFDMSECMKGCEMVRNKQGSKENVFGDCKSLCATQKAIEQGNVSDCEKSDGIMKDSCYSSVAYETLNAQICEKIADNMIKYGCYASIAEEKKDDSICNKIKDKMFKEACVESANSKDE